MIWLIFSMLLAIVTTQAVFSSKVNRGGHYEFLIFVLGLGISVLWIGVSKYSTNMIRDGLIWDMLIGLIFCTVFWYMGHGLNFGMKHWIGVILTFAVFVYWGIIK